MQNGMRRAYQTLAGLVMGLAANAYGGTLVVHVDDGHGHPAESAVVTLESPGDTATPTSAPATHTIDQRDETFIPYVEVMRPGDQVVFRNSDNTRHQVYSFSDLKRFEYVLRPGTSSPPLTIDGSGIIAVGCNIHDEMINYLFVTSKPARLSGKDGNAQFDSLAPGSYSLRVWHPQLKPGDQGTRVEAVVAEGSSTPLKVHLTLLPDPRASMDREHMGY
jgi:plastocyanin